MITNFEEITAPLNNDEKKLLLSICDVMKEITGKNPIKAPEIIQKVKQITGQKNFSQVRLRKMVNFIRANGILPIIATSKGYYTSYDSLEIIKEIKSMEERAESIKYASNGLKKFLEKKEQLSLLF